MTPEQVTEFNKLVDEVNQLKNSLNELKALVLAQNEAVKIKINQIVEAING